MLAIVFVCAIMLGILEDASSKGVMMDAAITWAVLAASVASRLQMSSVRP